jgi:signal transduction histidine kinase
MRLVEFIEQHHKKIIAEWVEFARTLHPWSEGLSDEALADHAEELLTVVVSDMKTLQSGEQQAEKSKGRASTKAFSTVAKKHATDRLESGFNLDQLVSEYRALRASVVRLWAEAHGDKQGELTRFNEAIDETLAESAARYSELMNHTREQFLAILGHDLRNPLGAITMGATMLTKSESIDDKQARVATRILNSAERMSRMVSDLLDLARTRLGSSIPIVRGRVNLTSVCELVIAELEVVHTDHRLLFEATGNLVGEWDGDRLTQVISNLVANALQYGGTVVSILAEGDDHEVALQVQNEGPVIPAGVLKEIFEPMARHPDRAGDKNATGLGLGLYIAREIVTAHGGTLEATSTEEEGTTFTVKLPRQPPKKNQTHREPRSRTAHKEDDAANQHH